MTKPADIATMIKSAENAFDEVAATAVFLCGDAAGGSTGSYISIDGGWTAK